MELSAWGWGELGRGSTCEEQRGKFGHGDWGEDEKLGDKFSASSRGLWSSDCPLEGSHTGQKWQGLSIPLCSVIG